jgi:hypothetical protein
MHALDLIGLFKHNRILAQWAILGDFAQPPQLRLVLHTLTLQRLPDLIAHHGNRNLVLNPARDDEVSDFSLRCDIFVEVGFDKAEPLLDAAFDIAAAFLDVADQTAGEAEVCVGFCENFQVEKVENALIV